MTKKNFFIVSVLFVLFQWGLCAQEEHSVQVHDMKGAHRLSIGLGHAHVTEGTIEEETGWLAAPSWALDYDYWISNKWAIGLHNEILIESFAIEGKEEEEVIERKYPVAIIPVGIWKPWKGLSLLAGVGVELAEGHNFTVVRLGVEYGFHLPRNFEIGAALIRDDKLDFYNTWVFGITISKIFPKKHHLED
jgi:hypothetical protein